jgi:hypothetical protein
MGDGGIGNYEEFIQVQTPPPQVLWRVVVAAWDGERGPCQFVRYVHARDSDEAVRQAWSEWDIVVYAEPSGSRGPAR